MEMEAANMDNADFFNLCRYHDWTWQRANGKEWRAGNQKEQQIQNLLKGEEQRIMLDPMEKPIKKQIYEAWKEYASDFQNKKKPELSDFGL